MVTTRQKRRLEAQRKIIQHFEEKIPYFTDIFDERTFYISFACLVVVCIIAAIVLSVCCRVTIRDADEIAREKEKRKRLKQQKLAEKIIRKKLDKAGLDPNVDMKKIERLKDLLEKLEKEKQQNESEFEFEKDL
ncbi:hypothetical protein BpHYR1_037604 [Brachionus plicatilis]|uniref:Uncharacterized protein n=1 Tax=Brachionus plicatilis TaxID=10195 RepID=A0A3M7S175_BRAPC|nr:hypothetical protein BpHYR1_037604 [Brachionus plicatilis]